VRHSISGIHRLEKITLREVLKALKIEQISPTLVLREEDQSFGGVNIRVVIIDSGIIYELIICGDALISCRDRSTHPSIFY